MPARRALRSDGVRRLLCWLIHLYIRFVYATSRWTVEGAAIPRALRQQGKPFILAFWHGRLLMMPMAWRGLAPMHMLISGHRDGRIIADAVRYFDIDSIAGSSTVGGTAALRAMVRHVRARRLRRHHPRRAQRAGDARRASASVAAAQARPRADHPHHLRHQPPPHPRQLGPLPPALSLEPRRLSLGRADRRAGSR